MNGFYPVNIRFTDKKIVIIGGGKMAERKIRSFQHSGANLEIVSPTLTETLHKLLLDSVFIWKQKYFSKEDIEGAFMVIAATNEPRINQAVKEHASANQLVCLLDNQDLSDVQFPAIVRRGKLIIATSTSGASPALSKKITEKLAADFDERYASYLDFLHVARCVILKQVNNPQLKKELLTEIVHDTFLHSNQRWEDFKKLLIGRNIELTIKEAE
ncbi:NAD(P)-binding protein [Bacillus sp. DNRA2]|uniref:NAD(P)-binding protein n=1 Tax=Bacillus sp. DNRA2 TaxID=2723053 RepID=UPI00145DDE23|nr:NAD(P)-binding protein [Bacillus sp. DNRA2]NMD71151.1 NAD(P)-binding protein [Bacillus sp. DNRA2]